MFTNDFNAAASSVSRTYVVGEYVFGTNHTQIRFRKFTLPKEYENTSGLAMGYYFQKLTFLATGIAVATGAIPIEMFNDVYEKE